MKTKLGKWMVYWYDTEEWEEINLIEPSKYAEHLFNSQIECILIPKKAYEDPDWKERIIELIKEEMCVLPQFESAYDGQISFSKR